MNKKSTAPVAGTAAGARPAPARRNRQAEAANAEAPAPAVAAKAAKTAAKKAPYKADKATAAGAVGAQAAAEPAAKTPAPAAVKKAAVKKAAAKKAAVKTAAAKPAEPATGATAAPPAARKASRPAAPAPKRAPVAAPTPAPAPRRSVLPIFQIYFKEEQRPGLDPTFTPLDNAGRDDPLREFAVFERLAAEPALQRAPLWGALSWRFGQKTGLSGAALLKAIADKPGQDLYFCNPYPEHEALYINGWQQGVPSHPAFTELCTAVLKAAGLDEAELGAVQSSARFSACNYFVGSPAFWGAYLPWVRGVVDRARAALPAAVLRVLDSPLSDPKGLHAGSTYWPFIVERLLPLFLRQAGSGLKVHKIALPASEARMNVHLQRLREMKDMAHRSKSRWLYGCWLNYRNLYMLQTAGAAWCKRYLPKISATAFDFR